MQTQSPQSKFDMNHRLRNIRHVALDMDGTIYQGSTLFTFTKSFLARLTQLGIGYTFLTNNPSKSAKDYLKKLDALGIEASESQLYTSTMATIEYLQEKFPTAKRLFTLGTPSMQDEFRRAGYAICEDSASDEPDVLVVAFDMTLVYSRLCRAAWWAKRGKPYIATNPDRICPTDQPTVLVDCASIYACIKEATGRAPDKVLGKPDPCMLRGILHRHSLKPNQLAMCGDRTYTDLAMAHRAKAFGVLVLTGETTPEEAKKCSPEPDLIVPSLKEFGEMLEKARSETVCA